MLGDSLLMVVPPLLPGLYLIRYMDKNVFYMDAVYLVELWLWGYGNLTYIGI